MFNKFLQRSMPENLLLRSRQLTEDVNALKARDLAGASTRGGGGGSLAVSIASVTTSNVTGVENTHHILDLSGLTANRDFNLPTPSESGVICKVTISAGNDTYHLIVKKSGTEFDRLFISNETLEFTATGTGSGDWQLTQDGIIGCIGVAERSTAQSINTGVATRIDINNPVIDIGGMLDTVTNYRIDIRRSGNYELQGEYYNDSIDDQEIANCYLYVDDVSISFDRNNASTSVANTNQTPKTRIVMPLTAGQHVKLYVIHSEGGPVNTLTTFRPRLSVIELRGGGGAGGGGGGGSASQNQIMAIASIGI